jgi:capsular polysaccharide biosynthesis protein/Mrp family chromosome partitioning ATPase
MAEHLPRRENRLGDDEPVDLPRHVAALKRSWPLMVLIVLSLTGAVLALSVVLPKTYQGTARIVMDDSTGSLQATDVETVKRRLATVRTLLTTRGVLASAARRLSGASADSLKGHVHPSVNRDANIIDITADDGDPKGAAAIANAVALSFLEMQRAQERRAVDRARAQLTGTLEQLRGTPGSADEVRAIRDRLNALSVSKATIGTDLRLAQAAVVPDSPVSPQPVKNTVFAFFAAIFVAVLAALGIGQLVPRLSGARQLSRILGVPVLGAVPNPRTRRVSGDVPVPEDAFGALHATLEAQLTPADNIVLLASGFAGEGTSSVAAGLAQALARGRNRTLLVSANLGEGQSHDSAELQHASGLTDILDALSVPGDSAPARARSRSRASDGARAAGLIEDAVQTVQVDSEGSELDILPVGQSASLRPLAGNACATLFEQLRRSHYRFIIVDGPPLLQTIGGQLLARYVDAVVLVSRIDRVSPSAATELGELVERLPVPVLGVVAVGAQDAVPQVLAARIDRVHDLRPGAQA